ncbi:hypothetical protein PLESTB_000620900 [Pleodorina starrii]|uniref:SnoaL-like domain-containing protein n=1 Tax=Pleodorina starrii TaxID=330485 RepID=A0A9W6BHL2_9CHLO|nr:hypothetical protein PLESTB_000620900 [Pleodorina starrii]
MLQLRCLPVLHALIVAGSGGGGGGVCGSGSGGGGGGGVQARRQGGGRGHSFLKIPTKLCMQEEATSSKPSVASSGLSGKDVIVRYYQAYNAGDLDTIAGLLAPDVSYHDMIYEDPFVGREAVVKYLKKVRATVPSDLQFVIEDVTDGDPRAVGITWHVECGQGVVFPFSRGCSFYTLNQSGQISGARDLVESAAKPGSSALKLLAALTPLVRRLGPAADPSTLKRLPLQSAAVWAFYLGYTAYIMLGSSAPGAPAYATPPEVLSEVLYESFNFFYVNIALSAAGLPTPVPCVPCPPVSEALFNFMAGWGLMMLPVMVADGRSRKLGGGGRLVAWWTGIMFLTNVFFIPYLALRAAPEPITDTTTATTPSNSSSSSPASSSTTTTTTSSTTGSGPAAAALPPLPPPPPPNSPLPSWAPAFGATALAVGLFSLGWAAVGRPEYGGLDERVSYFVETLNSNRVFFAFVVDACLYSVWQAVLLEGAPARYRFVPFFGMAAHLLSGGRARAGEEEEDAGL